MDRKIIEQILTAPLVLLRPSNEEERGLFPSTSGTFYTVGLQSGQNFVALLPGGHSIKDDDDPFSLNHFSFRLRPVNNLVPQLEEIKWVCIGTYGGPGHDTHCTVTPGTTEKEKALLEEVLSPKEGYTRYGVRIHCSHEMFIKLNEVYNQRLENDRLKHALIAGQEKLQNLMLPNNNNLKNQKTQYIMNEGR